jgi:hypothetical protein
MYINDQMEEGTFKYTGLVMLDLQQVFDTVDHKHLLVKELMTCEFPGLDFTSVSASK